MAERCDRGTWVEIHATILEAGERAPRVPEDTGRLPLEMRTKGFLTAAAAVGEEVEILTATQRRITGTLLRANPGYEHGFGPPVPALVGIGGELRALLGGDGEPP